MSADRLEFGDHGEDRDELDELAELSQRNPETGTVHDPGDGSVPTYFPGPGETNAPGEDSPLTAAEQAELKRREAVENALFNAEEVAEAQGFPELSKALARLSLLWELGAEAHAVRILDKVRNQVLASLRAERPLDKEGEAGAE